MWVENQKIQWWSRVQRKSFLQLAIRASWSQVLLAPTSFQLAPKFFWLAELISQFFCYSNSSKSSTCPSGKLKTEFTSSIAKSTSPRLSDTTFFACWWSVVFLKKHTYKQFWACSTVQIKPLTSYSISPFPIL